MKNVSRKILLFVSVFALCLTLTFTTSYTPTDTYVRNNGVVVAEAAETTDSYYSGLDTNLNGTAFRREVASLITRTHVKQTTYDGLRNVFPSSDKDPYTPGNILWFYTGTSVPFNGSFNTGTNREHVWPKQAGKAFPKESECGSDSHHLRPANSSLNSSRSNNNFGEVPKTNGNIVVENGSTSYKYLCYQANNTFYPGENYRGATARVLMYVQTRWGDKFNLEFVLGTGFSKTIGDIEDLMKWHYQEPPTEEERLRNEAVFAIQGNRNPFIDHPEYATKIYCHDGKSYNSTLRQVANLYDNYTTGGDQPVIPSSITVTPENKEIKVNETFTITCSAQPLTAQRAFSFKSSDELVASVNAQGVVTGLTEGTARITVTETNSNLQKTVTVNVLKDGLSGDASAFRTYALFAKAKMNSPTAYDAIINAINCYRKLNEEERLLVSEEYASLLTCIETYNSNTELASSAHKKATENALAALDKDKRKTGNTLTEGE